MKNADILLVNLPTGVWYKDSLAVSNSMPPLGLMYLAAYASKMGFEVRIADFAVEKFSADVMKNYLDLYKPKIIGMSTYNESWKMQKLLCKYINSEYSDAVVVAGGAFATFCYEDVLTKTATDYVLCGEGEISFAKLCESILNNENIETIRKIPGICYLDDLGCVQSNGLPDRIKDLDSLPFPRRDLINIDKYVLPFTICTSRGCPGDCIFCSSKAFWGKRVMLRSAKSVFDEVMEIHNTFNANLFYIADDTFTASVARCNEFCRLIVESGIKFSWGCESRADVVNDEMLRTLKEAGCNKIQFGFESADNNILKLLKKNVTIEQIENAVKIAHKYNMHIQTSYIIGHAFDTKETIEKTIKFAEYLRDEYGARVAASVNTPFSGTEQYDRAAELGITVNTKDWSQYVLNNPIISTRNVSSNKLGYYLDMAQKLIR